MSRLFLENSNNTELVTPIDLAKEVGLVWSENTSLVY
jgi:hypothetical protein